MGIKKLNVLHVINSLEIGGAETFLLRLITQQKKEGHTPFLLVINPQNNDARFEEKWKKELPGRIFYKWSENKLVKVIGERVNGVSYRVSRQKVYDKYNERRRKAYYNGIISDNKIDLVNSHLLGADFFVLDVLKKYVNFPFVITSQGCYNDYKNEDRVVELVKEINGMTYVATKNLNIFNKAGANLPKAKKLVYNGLPLPDKSTFKKRSEFGLKAEDFVFGQVTRSIETKGMEVSIKAVIDTVEKHKLDDLKLVIVGPENGYYINLKEKYKAYEYIIFPGVAITPTEFVGMFNVGMLPSYFPSESCPSTIVEYLSCEVPVISSGVGEIKSMVSNEGKYAGIVIDSIDEDGVPLVSEYAKAVFNMYSDSKLYESYKSLTLGAYRKFSIDLLEKEYFDIYQKSIQDYLND